MPDNHLFVRISPRVEPPLLSLPAFLSFFLFTFLPVLLLSFVLLSFILPFRLLAVFRSRGWPILAFLQGIEDIFAGHNWKYRD